MVLLYGGFHAHLVPVHRYVWIYPYTAFPFPDGYPNLWCERAPHEVYELKNILKGSFSIGITRGFGTQYNEFIDNFPETAERITGDFNKHEQFLTTAYAYDSAMALTNTLEHLVKQKADRLSINVSSVTITKDDRLNLAAILRNTTNDGLTGKINFAPKGDHRRESIYTIRNLVPVSSDFTVNNSKEFSPWLVEIRARIVHGEDEIQLFYLDGNGTEVEGVSFVFADGTSRVPSDTPYRPLKRSELL